MIMMMETNTAVPQQAIPPQPATTPPTPPVMTRPDEEQSSPSSPASSSLLSPKMNAGDQSATSPSSHPEVAPPSPATSPHPHPHPLHHSPSSSPSFHTQNIPGNLSPSTRLHPHPSEQSIVTDEAPCNDEPTFETSSGHAQHYTPTPPPPEGLERIGKLFGSSPGSEEDGLANASQLLAAAVAAATVAASGNLAALSPQEQWLASMAPTLLHMITGGAGGVGGGQPANQDTGSSPDASGDDDDSNDQSMASSSVGKRRKQSKPVRYQDEPGGLHFMSPFESVLEQAAAARKAAATLASTAAGAVSKSSVGKRAQFGSSLSDAEHDEDDEDDDDDDEEEEEEHRRQGDAQGEPSSEEDEDGNQVTERSRLACDKSSTTPLLVASSAGSAAVPVEGTVALSGSSPAEDDEVLREKQQQLLANMFANLQEKLIHSVFCPQCNCPFPNEDSLRAHIEIEHMQKLNFFSEAAAAAAAAAAANNSPDALHLKQIAEMHLAMQAKLQEQFHQEAAQRLASSKRKRKLNRSPSSRSVSSVSSLDSADSTSPRQKELLDREDGQEGGGGSPSHHQAKSRKRSSKDLNHNLLQSLNHLAPNLISPLISSLNGSKPQAGGPHSPHSLLQQHQHQQQQQARLLSGSPPGAGGPEQISPSSGEHHRLSPSSNPAAALASMIPGLSPYFFNNFMSQSGGSVVHPNGQVQFREHLQGQQQGHPFGPAGGLPSSHHPSSAISLNGGAPPAGGHPSNTSAAAAAAAAASLRIFNPEAYCELCNKEFCNKYFLKTHKANKHGIYTPDSGERGNSNSSSSEDQRQRPLGQSASSGQAGSPVHHHLPPTSNSLAALMGGTPTSNGHNTITTTTTNNSSSSLKASPSSQQQQPHGAPLPGDFGGHSPNQPGLIPGFPGGPMRLNLNLNMINLDSYCEICQKEFCNKYFLKKHKQKIHGYIYQGDTAIPPPNIAAQFVAASQQPNHPAQLQQLQQLQMLQQQLVAQQSQQQQQQQQQQYRRSPDPRGASECKSGASPPPPTSQSANQLSVITSAASLTHADKSQNSSESFSPAPGAIAPEKLHSLGVINADAFCEICCKEFCNKYFLRTHKVNKHGLHDGVSIAGKFAPNSLLVNSERHSAAPGGAGEMTPSFGGLFPSPNGASSPANGSAASQASGDDTGLEPGQRDPATYGKNGGDFLLGFASATGAAKCALCPAHFPSTYLMNMHKAYVHNIPYGSLNGQKQENGTKEEIKSEEIDGEPKETKYDPSSVDSDVETEVSHVAPSFLVSAELNQDSSQHSMASNRSKDGQDLAKLHSMIRGLMPGEEVAEDGAISRNGRSGADEPKIACHICKYELENRYYLRAHLINEHGFPPTEEAFLQMLNATSGMNFLTEQQAKEQLQQASLGPQGPGSSEAYCEICNKEFCSKYFLKTHKQKIHNIVDGSSPSGSQNGALEGPPQSLFSSLYQAAALQQQHAQSAKSQGAKYASSSPSANPNIQATIKAALAAGLVPNSEPATPTGPPKGPTNGLRAPVMTGRNYCNICNKELCNKYFMKTHMLKMHNINIDEHPFEAQQSSTIGGVTCDICQKELCSKYFLKVHKQNTHGIYEDGSAPPVLLGASGSPGFPGGREAGRSGGGRGRNSNANVNPMLHPGVNGPGQMVPEGLGGLNPMLFMSMIQNAAAQAASQAAAAAAADSSDSNSVCSSNSERDAKLHGLDPVTDAGHRLFASFTESCQLCERRFKSMKWLKAHMMNDHGEVLQMMRTSGEIVQAFAQSTGANAESLARMCFVCGQTFNDRLAATIHLVKEHKMTSEDLALNLPSNFKMLAIMAAAAAAAQQNGSNGPDGQSGASDLSLARDESPLSRRTPLSRSSTPSSPKPDDRMLNGSHHLLANPAAALQHLLLAKQSGLNPMALLAAQGGNPWAMAGMMDFAGGTAEEAQLQLQQAQQQQQSQQPASQQVSPFPFTVNSRPTGHGNTKNPPGKFVCSQCFRTYRHSHSLQRHILATHKKNQTPGGQQQQPQQPPTAASSAPTAQSVTATLGPLVPVTPSLDTKLDQNGTPAGGPNQKPRNKRYRCSKCNKKFRTRELCLVHIRALHSIAPTTPKLSADPLSMSIAPSTPESSSRIIFTSPNSALARNGAVTSTHTEADLPLALTLGSSPRSTPEPPVSSEASSHHQLPPSPSASSEDDLLNGHHHPHNPKAHLPSLTRSQAYLPQSPLEDEEEENAGGERDLSAKERADSLAAKILNLSHAGDAKDCTEANSPASPSSSLHARPSLICVNGEKF